MSARPVGARLRTLRRADHAATARLAGTGATEARRALLAMERSRGLLLERCRADGRAELLAALVWWSEGASLRIVALDTRPPWRRRGLARRLVAALATRARRLGRPRLTLEVRADNAAALSCYAALGFAVVARLPAHYAAEGGGDGLALVLAVAPSR